MRADAESELLALRAENAKLKEALHQIKRLSHQYQDALKRLKQAEEKLAESEAMFRTLAEQSPNMIFVNAIGPVVYANWHCEEITGYKREEILSPEFDFLTLIAPEDREKVKANFARYQKGEEVPPWEYTLITRDGRRIAALVSTRLIQWHGKPAILGVVTDISALKRAEEGLRARMEEAEKSRQATLFMLEDLNESRRKIEQAKQEWVATFDAVTEPIFVHDEEGRILRANRAYAAAAGVELGQIIGRPYWEVFPKRDGPLHSCLRPMETGEKEVHTADGRIWRSHAYALRNEQGRPSFAVHFLRDETKEILAQQALEASHAKLRSALEGTIRAIATVLETRDPYTAGHQRRVAELAVAIAEEMGLDVFTIEGIHLGAQIHDIGKIYIPAEILSKPGRLTDIEYKLIQSHPQVGYDILKSVDFPWPVANIAYQHHERLDGSGYPQGLKGDQILLEARIVAVADVVEAMATHRPYRPGLGIEAALNEIKAHKGTYYDAAVVDACLALFAEKRFTFKN